MASDTLAGKNVLVTGANRGIGAAIVEAAISRGAAKVYAAVRDERSTRALQEKYGDKIRTLKVDLQDAETISAAAQQATDVDIVINNAGVLKNASPLDEGAIEALKFEMDVNVYGLLRVAQAFASTLAERRGVLVQLNSVASIKAFADFATYAASKAASYSLTQALREKLSQQGVAVVSVHPGPIATDMADAAGLGDIAEPPSLVADAIFDAISQGQFHVWPDSMARDFGQAYSSYATQVVESQAEESTAG